MTGRRFVVDLDLGNDAMRLGVEVADALTRVAATLRPRFDQELDTDANGPIHDLNGNTVGSYFVEEVE